MFLSVNTSNELVRDAVNDLNGRAFRQQASLFVIQCEQTKRILVVKRFKDNQIGLPCGKIDSGEAPIDAAFRELYEETGIGGSRLVRSTRYIAAIQFEGTLVHVYSNNIAVESGIGAAPGFERETLPQWFDISDLVKLESRFQSFNIVALHKAGLL